MTSQQKNEEFLFDFERKILKEAMTRKKNGAMK